MRKIKNSLSIISILIIMFVFSFAFVVSAKSAQNQEVNQEQNTSTVDQQNQEQNEEQGQEQQGQINAEEHQSAVSNFVQGLLNVADKEQGGIGEQVRTIAQQQNQSASTTIKAMEKIQIRNKVKTFLIGTDYKNIGQLRSEIVKTENQINQLNGLVDKTTSEENKTILQAQIQVLEQEQQKINDFLKVNESKFSLFGWFVKLFNK